MCLAGEHRMEEIQATNDSLHADLNSPDSRSYAVVGESTVALAERYPGAVLACPR